MSISNPSHTLINRNPRSLAHPQLAPTVSGRHHQTTPLASPQPLLGAWPESSSSSSRPPDPAGTSYWRPPSAGQVANGNDPPAAEEEDEGEEEEEMVDVHQTFLADAEMVGRVKVVVGKYEFWCHKEVLWFASPFFKGLLQGSWAETNPLSGYNDRDSALSTTSPTDIDGAAAGSTLVPSPSIRPTDRPALEPIRPEPTESPMFEEPSSFEVEDRASVYLDAQDTEIDLSEVLRELSHVPGPVPNSAPTGLELPTLGNALPGTPAPLPANPLETVAALNSPVLEQRRSSLPRSPRRNESRRSTIRHSFSSVRPSSPSRYGYRQSSSAGVGMELEAIAVVHLHEESASAFQDFLFWAYPHLECKVTWTNVENLLALAMKLLVPPLQKLCLAFLMTHASGRPVIALALAEQYSHSELYREASRFVLDQPTWNVEDMETLSDQTQLKLSQKRTWFLERLLKLGSIDVRKEYQCRPDCPTPEKCQIALDDKWRQAHSAVSRYGPPQPSVAFRCLRQLETFPTNPSLVMGNPLCQSAAKTWVMTLFDRMFQPKVLPSPSSPGTEKYWLWITLL